MPQSPLLTYDMWHFGLSKDKDSDFGEDDSSGVRMQPDHFPNVARPGGGYHKDTIVDSEKPAVFCDDCNDEIVDGSCLRCDWGEQNRAVPMPNYPLDPFRDDKAGIRAGSWKFGMGAPKKWFLEKEIKKEEDPYQVNGLTIEQIFDKYAFNGEHTIRSLGKMIGCATDTAKLLIEEYRDKYPEKQINLKQVRLTPEQKQIIAPVLKQIFENERIKNKNRQIVHLQDHPEFNIQAGDGMCLLSSNQIFEKVNKIFKQNKIDPIEFTKINFYLSNRYSKEGIGRTKEELTAIDKESLTKIRKNQQIKADKKYREIVQNLGLRWVIPHNHLLKATERYPLECLKCNKRIISARNPEGLYQPTGLYHNWTPYCQNCDPNSVVDQFNSFLDQAGPKVKKDIESQIKNLTNNAN